MNGIDDRRAGMIPSIQEFGVRPHNTPEACIDKHGDPYRLLAPQP